VIYVLVKNRINAEVTAIRPNNSVLAHSVDYFECKM
jgi:hypothetical protein